MTALASKGEDVEELPGDPSIDPVKVRIADDPMEDWEAGVRSRLNDLAQQVEDVKDQRIRTLEGHLRDLTRYRRNVHPGRPLIALGWQRPETMEAIDALLTDVPDVVTRDRAWADTFLGEPVEDVVRLVHHLHNAIARQELMADPDDVTMLNRMADRGDRGVEIAGAQPERTVGRSGVGARGSDGFGVAGKSGRPCPVLYCIETHGPQVFNLGDLESHLAVHGYDRTPAGAPYWAGRAWADPKLVIVLHPDGITEVVEQTVLDSGLVTELGPVDEGREPEAAWDGLPMEAVSGPPIAKLKDDWVADQVDRMPDGLPSTMGDLIHEALRRKPCDPGRHVWTAKEQVTGDYQTRCLNCGITWDEADADLPDPDMAPVEIPLDRLFAITRADIIDRVDEALDGLQGVVRAQMIEDQKLDQVARDFLSHHSEAADLSCGCNLRLWEGAGSAQVLLRPCDAHRRSPAEVLIQWKVDRS